jgi:hypothetical protein
MEGNEKRYEHFIHSVLFKFTSGAAGNRTLVQTYSP